jgi:2-oxoglutarate ferredoxin oxidoreductase subunit alpha
MMYGDYLIAHTYMSVDVSPVDFGELPPKDWALDGTRGGTGHSRQIWTWALGKAGAPGLGPDKHWQQIAEKFEEVARCEQRWESSWCDDAETVVVSFGTAGPFVEQVVEELRADGVRIGAFRPVSLWPFPESALASATGSASRVLVFEVNAGQMIDDVRLAVAGRVPVTPIGRVSIDFSGMRQGEILTVPWIRERVRDAIGLASVR